MEQRCRLMRKELMGTCLTEGYDEPSFVEIFFYRFVCLILSYVNGAF